MGSRGYLRLGNTLVLDSDNREVNPLHLALFQDIDLELRARDGTSLTVDDAISLNQDGEGLGYGEDDEPRVTALYSATAASVKDRLNAMGFGLQWCEREFSAGKSERLMDDRLRDLNVGRGGLESLTFATWMAGFTRNTADQPCSTRSARSPFATTTSDAPMSAATAIHSVAQPPIASTRNTAFTTIANPMFCRIT